MACSKELKVITQHFTQNCREYFTKHMSAVGRTTWVGFTVIVKDHRITYYLDSSVGRTQIPMSHPDKLVCYKVWEAAHISSPTKQWWPHVSFCSERTHRASTLVWPENLEWESFWNDRKVKDIQTNEIWRTFGLLEDELECELPDNFFDMFPPCFHWLQLRQLPTPLGTSVGSVGTSSSQCIVNSQVFSTDWVQHEDNDLKEMSKRCQKRSRKNWIRKVHL